MASWRSGAEERIHGRLIRLLVRISDQFGGRPIRIVSGFRPHAEARFTPHSKHTLGRAVDFSIPGIPNDVLRDYLRQTMKDVGIGYYPNSTHVHLDIREEDQRTIRRLLGLVSDRDAEREEEPAQFREGLSGWGGSARGRRSSSKEFPPHPLSHSELLPTTAQSEPAPARACDTGAAASAPVARDPGTPLPDEQPLKDPAFSVSSRQNSWKPFFLPMDRAFVIRASGQMQPLERVRATGPNGIDVPANVPRWTYPGTKNVVVDADHVLLEKGLPYQALIGRLCGPKECGDPFLIGAERTICPSPRYNERIELWINHIVPQTSERHLPFASLTFQSRRGEYRFEIASAPPCGG